MKILSSLARLCAILAGVLMTAITLVTCASLIGRNTVGATLMGDYELTAVTAGAAVALFLPWAQLRPGNIILDFFTAKVPDRLNAREEVDSLERRLNGIYVHHPGRDYSTVEEALERDNFFTSEAALAFGLIDKVIDKRPGLVEGK